VAEILSYEKHALVVPRVKPRHEQLIRVERLRDLGLVHMLHPTQISPEAIGNWLAHDLGTPPKVHDKINMRGLEHLPHLVENILSSGLEEQSRFVAEGALDRVA
jgi:predicted glycosyltransferase